MTNTPKGRRYLRFWGSDPQADVDDEFRFHLETEIEELVAKGMTPEAARDDAMRRFGDVAYYRRYCEQADARRGARERRANLLDALRQDVRFTIRSLIAQPVFTIVAVITLGLGIGANTAIFSVVNGVLLAPLPYREPDRLVRLWESMQEAPKIMVSYPDYLDWRARTHSFEDLSIYNPFDSFNYTGNGDPERIHGGLAASNLFSVLGVDAQQGRLFTAADDRPESAPVVVITDKLWHRRFNGDSTVVGKRMTLDGTSYTIVGVLPPQIIVASSELWLPLGRFTSTPRFVRANHPGLIAVGRLKPGVTIEQMRGDLKAVARQIEIEYPKSNQDIGANGAPLLEAVVGLIKPALLMLSGAVALVLLVACANVANLLLGRAAARQREFAVRVAIGAGRGRLVAQLLTESVILAVIGGALGVALAAAGVKLLVSLHPSNIPRLTVIHVDGHVLAFALAVSVVTGLLFGLVPALQSARADAVVALRDSNRGTSAGRTRMRTRATLTVAEVALALVLLVGAGLLFKSFVKLMTVDPGFDKRHVVAALVQLPPLRYPDESRRRTTFEQLVAAVRANPGVDEVALATDLPIGSSWQTGVVREGTTSTNAPPLIAAAIVTPGFFHAMRMTLAAGRDLSVSDRSGQPPVAVLSKEAARRLFGTTDVVGKRIKQGNHDSPAPWITVVGVVGDVKNYGLDASSPGTVYFPSGQTDMSSAWLVVRSTASLDALGPRLRRDLASIDGELPLAALQTLEQTVDETVAQPRFSLLMLGIFATVALLLAAIGLFGVVSYGVAQRSREIGVRIALGAQRADILRMVVGQGMALAAAGVVIGTVAAIAGGRVIVHHLFDVKPFDPIVLGAVASTVFLTALIAAAVPALRATRIDPADAIRD